MDMCLVCALVSDMLDLSAAECTSSYASRVSRLTMALPLLVHKHLRFANRTNP